MKSKNILPYIVRKRDDGYYMGTPSELLAFDTPIELLAYCSYNNIQRIYTYHQKQAALELIKALKDAGYKDMSIDGSQMLYDYQYKYTVIGQKFYTLRYKQKEHETVEVYDFSNITNMSLYKIHKKLDKIQPSGDAIECRLSRLLERCLMLGLTHSTIASCAFADFTSMVGKKNINHNIKSTKQDHEEYSAKWRRSYKSGINFIKEENCWIDEIIHIFDANALYPFVLSTDEILGEIIRYPSSECVHVTRRASERFEVAYKAGALMIAGITIKGLKLKKDGMPFFTLNDSNDYFPGAIIYEEEKEINTYINSVEFRTLKENYDFTYDITEYWVFGELIPSETFGGYYDKWYNMRRESISHGDSITEIITKFMCNALSGRFGLKSDMDRVIYDKDGNASTLKQSTTSRVSIPIASFFIAYAKRYMVKIAKEYYNDGRLYYTDTDSFHITGDILPQHKDLLDDATLGKFKEETADKYKGTERGYYIRQKVYILADTRGTPTKVTVAGLNEKGQDWMREYFTLLHKFDKLTIPGGSTQLKGTGLGACTVDTDFILDTHTDILTTQMLKGQALRLLDILGL